MSQSQTVDRFLGGRLEVRQPKTGYRAGLDAIFLAAAVPDGERLLEAGCGAGAALLAAAQFQPNAELVGIEQDRTMADLAVQNISANKLEGRVAVWRGDLFASEHGGFDGIFLNPPFLYPHEGRDPLPERRHAFIANEPLARWIGVLSNKLIGGGALTLIHRADRLGEILSAVDGRLGGIAVYPLRPREGGDAHRLLVTARKGSRAPLRLLAGLTLHGPGQAFAPEAQKILMGEARLSWNF